MTDNLIFLPYPRQLTYLPESYKLESGKLIILGHSHLTKAALWAPAVSKSPAGEDRFGLGDCRQLNSSC
jgi:hypothetical protein